MSSRLIYGFHAVTAKLRHDPESIKEIFIDGGRQDARARDLIKHAELQSVRLILADGKRLDGMAPEARHQGVIARIEGGRKVAHLDDVLDTLEEPAFLLVLDGVTDPRNLGACLRVADAVGAHAVVAPKDRAVGLTDVAPKTACGAAETMPYVMVTNLARTLRELQEREIWVVGTAGEAESALTDPLTNLPNRRHGLDFLQTEWTAAQDNSRPLSLLMLDIDHFKQINDRYGHPAGDAVLHRLAELLRAISRAEDLVFRYGGEEFAVVLPGAPLATAIQVAERIRRLTAVETFEWQNEFIAVTVSIGAACRSERTADAEALVNAADEALYQAKQNGRNRVAAART